MKIASLIAAAALLGGCYSAAPTRTYPVRRDYGGQVFDAHTTNGDFVRVQQDARTGDLFIVEPAQLSGERVAMINRDDGSGLALVSTDVSHRRYHREGSGGETYPAR